MSGVLDFTDEQQEMLAEAGFEPCYVRNLSEGDSIAISHEANRDRPTEMVVSELWTGAGGVVRHWIGVLPTGRKVHCGYNESFPCWRQP